MIIRVYDLVIVVIAICMLLVSIFSMHVLVVSSYLVVSCLLAAVDVLIGESQSFCCRYYYLG